MKKFWKGLLILLAVVAVALLIGAGVFYFMAKNTDIPKLYFEGDISQMLEKSDVRNIAVTYDDGERQIQGFAELKIQGTSSIRYDKKNYTIKFYKDADHEDKLKIDVGWGEQSKYCLKANWIDRTHARNVVTAKLVSQAQAKYDVLTQAPKNGAVDGFPVEIYSNGKFLGLYTFNIPKDAWQFAMDEDNPNHLVICSEEANSTDFEEVSFQLWELEVGEETEETAEKIGALFDFITKSSDEEFKENFEKYLDLDAALNYHVFCKTAFLVDNLGRNMILCTYDGVKWYPCLYDMDSSWGSDCEGDGLWEYDEWRLDLSDNLLMKRLEEHFPQELSQRYSELRQEILSREHIMEEFERFRDDIPELTFVKEGMRWGDGVIRRVEDLPGFGYEQIEDYLDTVLDDLDAEYAAMAQ